MQLHFGIDPPYGITYVSRMTAISATAARADLYHLIDQVNEDAEPVTITGQRGNAVLIGESDWRAIQETLFLGSVPGFTESIRQARAAGVQEGSTELDW
jgi:prevent-host-death family protein